MKLKKLLIAGIVVLSTLSCVATPILATTNYYSTEGITVNTNLGNGNVKLANIDEQYIVAYSRNGTHSYRQYKLTFLVRNCTYNKTIVVHSQLYENEDEWGDSKPAKYVKTLSDGTEVWELTFTHQAGTKFCVWYKEVNSWDNNNYADYEFSI